MNGYDKETIVQCKAHKNPVGPAPVREIYGTMQHRGASEAIIASLGGFSAGARAFAQGKPIVLIDIEDIIRMEDAVSQKKAREEEAAELLAAGLTEEHT